MNKQTGIIILLVGLLAGTFLSGSSVNKQGISLGGARDFLPFLTTATSSRMAVTTSSSQILASTTCSQYIALVNDGSNTIYLALDADKPAVANQGIRLNSSGGSFEMSANDANLYNGAIRAISTTGNSSLTITCK